MPPSPFANEDELDTNGNSFDKVLFSSIVVVLDDGRVGAFLAAISVSGLECRVSAVLTPFSRACLQSTIGA